jgi:putative FmdB family regulatory protein
MPIYEYHCAKCGDFEVIQKMSDKPLGTCPTCRRKVNKLISSTSFQLKGSGWYITDYARKGGSGSGASEKGSKSEDKKNDASGSEGSSKADGETASGESSKSSSGESSGKSSSSESSGKSSGASKKSSGGKGEKAAAA